MADKKDSVNYVAFVLPTCQCSEERKQSRKEDPHDRLSTTATKLSLSGELRITDAEKLVEESNL